MIKEKTIMLTATKETRTSRVPLLRCAIVASTRPSIGAEGGKPSRLKRPPSVLVIEFRDEVYSALKSLLEAHGLSVLRATRGAEVAYASLQSRRHVAVTFPFRLMWRR